jgi:hypothetical protein
MSNWIHKPGFMKHQSLLGSWNKWHVIFFYNTKFLIKYNSQILIIHIVREKSIQYEIAGSLRGVVEIVRLWDVKRRRLMTDYRVSKQPPVCKYDSEELKYPPVSTNIDTLYPCDAIMRIGRYDK